MPQENPAPRSEVVDEYISLLLRVDPLTRRLQDAKGDQERTQLLGRGLLSLDQRIGEVGQRPEVITHMVDERQRALRGLEDLSLVGDLLPAEEVAEQQCHYSETLQFFSAFALRHGLDVTPVDTTPPIAPPRFAAPAPQTTEEPTSSEPGQPVETTVKQPQQAAEQDQSGEIIKRPVKLTILENKNGKFLGVGKKRIPFTNAHATYQTDYTNVRERALRFFVAHQDESLAPYDVWEGIGDGTPFDRNVMTQIRKWLTEITFNRNPIVIHNHGRKFNSRYTTNPAFALEIEDKKFENQQSFEDMPVYASLETSLDLETSSLDEEITLARELLAKNRLIFSHREAAVLIEFFKLHGPYLEQKNIALPNGEKFDAITKISAQRDLEKGKQRDTGEEAILAERSKTIRSFHAVFQSEELFDEMISSIDADDVRYPLLEYLMDINTDENWAVIDEILGGRQGVIITYDGDKKVRDIVGVTDIFVDEAGRTVTISTSADARSDDSAISSEALVTHDVQEEETQTPEFLADTHVGNELDSTPESKLSKKQKLPKSLQEFFDEIIEVYRGTSNAADQAVSLPSLSKMGTQQIRSFFPWINIRTIREACESKIVRNPEQYNGQTLLSIEEIIRIGLWKRDPNAYSLTKYKTLIETSISSVVLKIQRERFGQLQNNS